MGAAIHLADWDLVLSLAELYRNLDLGV